MSDSQGASAPSKPKSSGGSKGQGDGFVTWFKHWRSGKIIRASDYGLKAFPIGSKK